MTIGSGIRDPPAHKMCTGGSPAAGRAAALPLLCAVFYGLIVHLAVCTAAAGQLSAAAPPAVSSSPRGAGLSRMPAPCPASGKLLGPSLRRGVGPSNLKGRKFPILRTLAAAMWPGTGAVQLPAHLPAASSLDP